MALLNVVPVPHPDVREKLRDSTAVVIDVLRASSTIVEALNNGAQEIIPVAEPSETIRLRAQYPPGQVLLSGERMGLKIEGFDLGNSPFEYSPDKVLGKIIIMCSTNGTRAVSFASIARQVWVGCFRNMEGVVSRLNGCTSDICLIGSGKFGQFCLEDMVCAGGIVNSLSSLRKDMELSDSAVASVILFDKYRKNLVKMLQASEHGKYLISLGFMEDLKFCAQLNMSDRVPELKNGILQ